MKRCVHSPLLIGAMVVLAGCGSSFDPNQPVNELSDVERADLCNRIIEPLRDPEFIDDACVYAGYDDMTDPEMCRDDYADCLAFGGPLDEDLDAYCASEGVADRLDCAAPIRVFDDCIDPFHATLREFMAGISCDDASPDPVPQPPTIDMVPECEPLIDQCFSATSLFLY